MTLRPPTRWFAAILGGLVWLTFLHAARGAEKLEFNRDIRPLLSDRCFKCHGPDKAARKANLRLDQPQDAFAERKEPHTYAIVPRNPAQSLVVQKIFAGDPDDLMPPPKSNLSLNSTEKAKIRRWINEGAEYQPHWAFIPPPGTVAVPSVKDTHWPRTTLDRFILARLEHDSINPSPEADKTRWLRRVTYDLTGLPPTIAQIDAFLADNSKQAYETVVDALLASKHFGERMAVPWLDTARYADSYGYQSDQLCPTWPYRDWVVEAFNRNLPYDQFLTEQLAGDLLPKPTEQQRLATAFNRLHRQTGEGGSIEEEWRNEYVSDRVHTFSTAFLGLTFECARCHDHKFDPILQRDYYSLGAFFNSIDEYGLYNDAAHVPTPSMLLPTSAQQREMDATDQDLKSKNVRVAETMAQAEPGFQSWLQNPSVATNLQGLAARFSFSVTTGTNQIANELNATNFSAPLRGNKLATVGDRPALQFSGDDEFTLPENLGSLQPWDQYTLVFSVRIPAAVTNGIIFHSTKGTDAGFFGTELSLEDGHLLFVIKRFWPGNAIAVRSQRALLADRWVQVSARFDGTGKAAGVSLFLDGEPLPIEIIRDRLFKSPQNVNASISFGGRFRSTGLKGASLADVKIFNRALAPIEIKQLFDGHSLANAVAQKNSEALRPYYLALEPAATRARDERAQAVKTWLEMRDPIQETSVMEELPVSRPAYLLERGRYDAPKTSETLVSRCTPAALPAFPNDAPRNRLGLAQWLTDPQHPLTARVAVNRYWQMLFGRGLVATADNFGVQGSPPTHSELLDWLSRDFINSGWDTKAFLKQIVLSATYRQDSKFRADLRDRDPENLLLARGPSQRLPAEMIRDTALAASGLLQDEMGGQPVSPYSPGDLWRESNAMSPAYQQGVGESLYRRSLYTVWKRTAPMPDMTAFDAPSREVCTVKRNPTSTPQQAFVLLNDPQFVEASRVLAEKTLKEAGASEKQRVLFIFRRLTAREPSLEEMALLEGLLSEQTKIFSQEPDRAEKIVAVGDHKRDASLNLTDLAAMTTLAQAVLNLDATIWKR